MFPQRTIFRTLKLDEFIRVCDVIGIRVSDGLRNYRNREYFVGRDFPAEGVLQSYGIPEELIANGIDWLYLLNSEDWIQDVLISSDRGTLYMLAPTQRRGEIYRTHLI